MSIASLGTKTVKVPIGMRRSYFAPITAETAGAHPTYGTPVDMGCAVTGTLAITTATGEIPGDDAIQLRVEKFVSGQLDVETTCADLELQATLYGHAYGTPQSASTGSTEKLEISGADDEPTPGGYACIEPILLKDRSQVYRASVFFSVAAMASAEKMNAETRGSSLNPKMNSVSFGVYKDSTGSWRAREEFASEDDAIDWIEDVFGGTAPLDV